MDEVSAKLGEYMLKGWILTDNICPQCLKIPLMRSPTSSTQPVSICVICSSRKAGENEDAMRLSLPSPPIATTSQPSSSSGSSPLPSSGRLTTHDASHVVQDSPDRRQQSDRAASEIGRRLLGGWTMLADECPRTGCYGVPLVRPPSLGRAKDLPKECVICHSVYPNHKDTIAEAIPMSIEPLINEAHLAQGVPPLLGEYHARDTLPMNLNASEEKEHTGIKNLDTISSTLDETVEALAMSLQPLTWKLRSVSTAHSIDPAPLAQIADAITKVSNALVSISQLRKHITPS